MGDEYIIKVEHLTRKYITYRRQSGFKDVLKSLFHREKVEVIAVDDVSFHIKHGDIIGILGPNGAGKSTTIKMLVGALYPTEGSATVLGYTPWSDRKRYVQEIGAVFGQKSQLIFDLPPVDSFRMNKAIYGIPEEDYNKRLKELTELLDLGDKIYRPTRVLSLGERMKCEFIMAMLHDPKIIFLDEPTIGLDIVAKQNIRKFIQNMNEQGRTFILTTHDLEDVELLAKNVIIINEGKKVFDAGIDELRGTLGNKKRIELTLMEPWEQYDIEQEGIQMIDDSNPLKPILEVDVDIHPVKNFMAQLSDYCEFTDISIKELPMDQIIANIYHGSKSESA